MMSSVSRAVKMTAGRVAPLRQPLRLAPLVQRRMCTARAAPAIPDGAPAVDFNVAEANSVCIVGNLGADPELRTVRAGLKVANMNIAMSQGTDKSPLWMKVVMWNEIAEIASHFCQKGTRVRVLGRLKQSEWTGADAQVRKTIEVIASDVALVRPVEYADDTTQSAAPPPPPDAGTAAATPPQEQPAATGPVGDYASMDYAEKARLTEQMWGSLLASPASFYDNRTNKRNPKAPDFKHKESGWPLWLSSCPGHHRDALAQTLPVPQ